MGLEGAVRLGMRRELEAIEDPGERERAFDATVAAAYERGRGISMASYFEIDDVIDPADTPPLDRHAVRRRAPRLVGAAGQAPPEHRRLVAQRSRRVLAARRRRRAAAPRGSRPDPEPVESLSIARSRPGSSNATSRPH